MLQKKKVIINIAKDAYNDFWKLEFATSFNRQSTFKNKNKTVFVWLRCPCCLFFDELYPVSKT